MTKYSRQRESIYNDLLESHEHKTAEMVYESVREEQPNISLGTVYRNLSLLADNGQILKISTGIGPDYYDGCIEPHNHFICRYCGRVIDLDYLPSESFVDKASETFDGIIEGYNLQFFGKCGECLSTQ